MEDNEAYHLIRHKGDNENDEKSSEGNSDNNIQKPIIPDVEMINKSNGNIFTLLNDYYNDYIFTKVIIGFFLMHPLLSLLLKKKYYEKVFSDKQVHKIEKGMVIVLIVLFFIIELAVPLSQNDIRSLLKIITLLFILIHIVTVQNFQTENTFLNIPKIKNKN